MREAHLPEIFRTDFSDLTEYVLIRDTLAAMP